MTDFSVYVGRPVEIPVLVQDSAGDPVPLTGAAIYCQIRTGPGGSLVHDLSVGSGVTVAAPLSGVFVLGFTPTAAGVFAYDVFVVGAAGISGSAPLLAGTITVTRPVTVVP